jgi:hypothetical protein
VDDCRAFVTSANFTEAAQERNIEAGVLVSPLPSPKRCATSSSRWSRRVNCCGCQGCSTEADDGTDAAVP